eukprot:GDKH01010966.1.p1 GENE.GDKH01010966.1~~GDKH01010966.1.p1  ORF type:complete len:144 (+),score=50.98 GDKH01010966.1:1-432(+)
MGKPAAQGQKRKADTAVEAPQETKKPKTDEPLGVKRQLPSGVKYEIVKPATTVKPCKRGNNVYLRYEGRLAKTGKKFDSGSLDFRLGMGEMIAGFDQGVAGMSVGERRKIFVPAKLGYGAKKMPGLPANSDLVFDVTVTKIGA